MYTEACSAPDVAYRAGEWRAERIAYSKFGTGYSTNGGTLHPAHTATTTTNLNAVQVEKHEPTRPTELPRQLGEIRKNVRVNIITNPPGPQSFHDNRRVAP